MALTEATVAPVVDAWSEQLTQPFSAAERQQIAATLIALGRHLVPHIVEDAPLPPEREQAYLLARVVSRIEDWLTMAGASQRRVFKLEAVRLQPGSQEPALGLKSASHDEIVGLPDIGGGLAEKIGRYLARNPAASEMAQLAAVNGIGEGRVETLETVAYLERTSFGFISLSLWAFIHAPSVVNALLLLERSDFSLAYGDHNLLARRVEDLGGSVYDRFHAFLELVATQAGRASFPNGGTLASEAERWLARHELRRAQLEAATPVTGDMLADDSYVASAKAVIDGAQSKLSLMMFLGTAADGGDDIAAPLPLVEAMEEAAARGVDVRVILDQDDGGEPYRSFFINKPLVDRFAANGISVKFDERDTLLHSKVLVADDATTIVGSHNWTRAGFNLTNELSVRIDSAAVAQDYQGRFDALWDALPS